MNEHDETITVFNCGICKRYFSSDTKDAHEAKHESANQGLPFWRKVTVNMPKPGRAIILNHRPGDYY